MLSVMVRVNDLPEDCVTDEQPRVSFELASDVAGEALASATISCGSWSTTTNDQINNVLGLTLEPWRAYEVRVVAEGASGETAEGSCAFRTGRLAMPWSARWITDASIEVPKGGSPVPMVLRRRIRVERPLRRAWVEATALGIYVLELDGAKVGRDYLTPGLTSYLNQTQYQTYDLTEALAVGEHELVAHVAGGWAAGSFTYGRRSRISADRQAFLAELHLEYEEGSTQVVGTDSSWEVSTEGPYRMAEIYDGETYDATVDLAGIRWKPADLTKPRKEMRLLADYSDPVREQEPMAPVSVAQAPSGEWIYDFGQNMAGVVRAHIRGEAGQTVVFRHAEVLVEDELFVKSLRTAKATATYVCRAGEQDYQPRLTYMGFRYVGVSGIEPDDLELVAVPIRSSFDVIGSFACSNDDVNRLNENIRWGGFSNFVDIPTDCPQRDERQGWTGDTAVFARTACFNFDMDRFYRKWLRDMRSEQGRLGGIPMVVPKAGDNWPTLTTSCWGDSCILVPWAVWLSRGDKALLEACYPMMRKFLGSVARWSALFSLTPTQVRIWRFPFHFGDWCAPGEDIKQWLGKGKWVATAYHAQSLAIVAEVARILGHETDALELLAQREKVVAAYRKAFTDGYGTLRRAFQTGYVLPLAFGMTEGAETETMAANLERLVADNGHKLSTGFTGTPYLLFALSDTGHLDEAYRLLLQTECPSWLYEVRAGGTTIWERYDALLPDGTVNLGQLSDKEDDAGMVSFNHYANGAVGDWLYRRMVGIEPLAGGYRRFAVRPMPGGGITWAHASTHTPYGEVAASWRAEGERFELDVCVPVSCTAEVTLPDGSIHELASGTHHLSY